MDHEDYRPVDRGVYGEFEQGEFSGEVNARIEELEEEYEKKMVQWGEDFGSRIGQWLEGIFN